MKVSLSTYTPKIHHVDDLPYEPPVSARITRSDAPSARLRPYLARPAKRHAPRTLSWEEVAELTTEHYDVPKVKFSPPPIIAREEIDRLVNAWKGSPMKLHQLYGTPRTLRAMVTLGDMH